MEVILDLPDDIALRAQRAGLLTVPALQALLEAAMRRAAGSQLLTMAERLHAAGIPPVEEAALDDLIHQVRAERRNHNAGCA